MKAYWGVEVQLHASITSALDGGEWSDSHPGRSTRRGKNHHIIIIFCFSFIINIIIFLYSNIFVNVNEYFKFSFTLYMSNDGNFSLRHRIQTGSGAHPASYPMGVEDCFFCDKAAGA
jgi:hypothetical protein